MHQILFRGKLIYFQIYRMGIVYELLLARIRLGQKKTNVIPIDDILAYYGKECVGRCKLN